MVDLIDLMWAIVGLIAFVVMMLTFVSGKGINSDRSTTPPPEPKSSDDDND